MAFPVADSYSGTPGSVIAGGRFARPAWRRAMVKGQWAEIPTSLLSALNPNSNPLINPNYPARGPWSSTANFSSNDGVMIPWCGGTWDEANARFCLPLGGGHGDYAGNEAYYINLNGDGPQWIMPRPPSGALPLIAGGLPAGCTPLANSYLLDDGKETSGIYADGRPRSIHSYRKHVFVPGMGTVMAVQGNTYRDIGFSEKVTWVLDIATGEWEWKQAPIPSGLGYNSGGSTCFDTLRGCVYWVGAGTAPILRLDLTTWLFSQLTSTALNTSGDTAIHYLPEYDVVIYLCASLPEKFRVVDPATGTIYNPGSTGSARSVSGTIGSAWIPEIGLVFDINSAMCAARPTGNPKTDPWEWIDLPATGSPPNSSDFRVYSKFGYSKRLGGCYRFLNTARPWFYATE